MYIGDIDSNNIIICVLFELRFSVEWKGFIEDIFGVYNSPKIGLYE